ncbi:MAG: MlaD family protein [bacterium]
MTFSLRHSDKMVGLFVLVGLLFLLGTLVFVGLNHRWLRQDPEFLSRFDTAEGLSTGLELQFRGFAIGRVKSLALSEGDQVEVVFSVFSEYADRIVAGSVVELAVQPLGFGSSLVLYPGRGGGPPLPPGTLIPSTDTPQGRARLNRGEVDRPTRRDDVAGLLDTLPPLVSHVDSLIGTLDRFLTRLDITLMGSGAIPDGGLLAATTGTLHTVDLATRQVTELTAQVTRTAEQLDPLMQSLTTFAGRLENPEGLVATLIGTDGSAAQFFHDDALLYTSLAESMRELRELMTFLNQSAPEIGILMQEATTALDESEKVMQGLQNNPLLRGGIPPEAAVTGTFEGYREGRR